MPAIRTRLLRATAAAVTTAAVAACGGPAKLEAPNPVNVKMVPATIQGDAEFPTFTLEEYKQGGEKIAKAGARSMVADGRVWEIRRGSVLIGALQVSTLKSKVDIGRDKTRRNITSLVMPGAVQGIKVDGVSVQASKTPDKSLFIWFGNDLFEVLQLKGTGLDAQATLKSIIEFQKPTGQLKLPVPGSKRRA